MNFLTPSAFIFAALLPILILLYMLKLKREKRRVPAVWLWERAIKDTQANRPFQKLQRNLLLLLQLIFLGFLILALARPFFMAEKLPMNNIAIIMDSSASMKSKDMGKPRFQVAKEKAESIIESMGENQKIMLITSGKTANVASPFSEDKIFLKKKLGDLKPVDTASHLKEAIILAASLLGNRENGEIYLFSDKGSEELSELGNMTIPINYVAIGEKSNNIAITALDVRYNPITNLDFQVFIAINNFYKETKVFNLELFVDENLVDVKNIEIQGDSRIAQIFELGSLFQGGLVKVKLDVEDALSVDDVAYSFVPKSSMKKVLLVTNGNFFLERALNVDPHWEIHKIEPNNFSGFDASDYDVVVFDNYYPKNISFGNYLFINSLPPDVQFLGQAEEPIVIDWDTEHGITRFLDFSDLVVSKSIKIGENKFIQPILFADKTPLIWRLDDQKVRAVIVGFDLFESNLPLKVTFPIFISNSIHWLSENSRSTFTGNLRTGETFTIYPPEGTEKIVLRNPNSEKIELSTEKVPIHFQQTNITGLYEIDFGDSIIKFAANLLDEEESNIRPENSIQLGEKTLEAKSGTLDVRQEIWRWLGFFAVIFLLLEWYVYHKKPF